MKLNVEKNQTQNLNLHKTSFLFLLLFFCLPSDAISNFCREIIAQLKNKSVSEEKKLHPNQLKFSPFLKIHKIIQKEKLPSLSSYQAKREKLEKKYDIRLRSQPKYYEEFRGYSHFFGQSYKIPKTSNLKPSKKDYSDFKTVIKTLQENGISNLSQYHIQKNTLANMYNIKLREYPYNYPEFTNYDDFFSRAPQLTPSPLPQKILQKILPKKNFQKKNLTQDVKKDLISDFEKEAVEKFHAPRVSANQIGEPLLNIFNSPQKESYDKLSQISQEEETQSTPLNEVIEFMPSNIPSLTYEQVKEKLKDTGFILKTRQDFLKLIRDSEEDEGLKIILKGVPHNPVLFYGEEWKGWNDFLPSTSSQMTEPDNEAFQTEFSEEEERQFQEIEDLYLKILEK